MVSVLMIPRSPSSTSPAGPKGRPKGVFLLVAAALLTAACDSVPLLAPSGSTIILTATNNAIAANGTAQLIAQVLEPSGTPPHPGTQVIFTTTLGVVEPGEVETDVNGRAMATFRPNGINGTATIIAASGAATTGTTGAVKIAVGTAAVGRVVVNATPATIPSGGTSTIAASVFDVNGTPLASTAVSFATDAGTLSTSLANTNGDGVATTSLTTPQTATITASVGATAPPSGGTGTRHHADSHWSDVRNGQSHGRAQYDCGDHATGPTSERRAAGGLHVRRDGSDRRQPGAGNSESIGGTVRALRISVPCRARRQPRTCTTKPTRIS